MEPEDALSKIRLRDQSSLKSPFILLPHSNPPTGNSLNVYGVYAFLDLFVLLQNVYISFVCEYF